MLKEHETLFRQLIMAVDVIIMGVCFFFSYQLRDQIAVVLYGVIPIKIYPIQTYTSLLPFVNVLCGWVLHLSGAYRSFRGRKFSSICLWRQ